MFEYSDFQKIIFNKKVQMQICLLFRGEKNLMKKTQFILLLMLLFGVFLIFPYKYSPVLAETQVISNTTLDGTVNQDIVITDPLDTAIQITGKVTLKNINIICNAPVTTLISVAPNSYLILDNVTITTNESVTQAIFNQGRIEINNTQFPILNCKYSIYNDSISQNAILLKSVGENQIAGVYLNQGAIYVGEETHFEDSAYINVQVTQNYSDITDRMIGLAVVKSYKSFAGYYLDNFRLIGAPVESSIKVTTEDALSIFQNNYYLDYVGLIGDNFEDYETFDTYYKETNNTETNKVSTVNSGDIIITKLNVWLRDSESEYQTDGKVYVAGKFASSRLFLKYTNNNSYYVDANTISTSYLNHLLMDNCTMLAGNLKLNGIISKTEQLDEYTSYVVKGANDKKITMQVFNEDGQELESKTIITSAPLDINGVTYSSRWIEFIPLNGKTIDSLNVPLGIDVKTLVSNQEFALVQVDISSSASATSNISFTLKKSGPKYFDVNINKTEFTYSQQNYLSDLVFSYFDENSKTVVLAPQDYKLVDDNGDTVGTLKNAGEYTIEIISTNPKIVFTNNTKSVLIKPKDIYVEYLYEYEYDGSVKSCEVKSIAGLIGDDGVNISFSSSATLPGIYPQAITLDNSNYKLDSRSSSVSLVINKKVLDLSSVKFTSASYVYQKGVVRSLSITGMPDIYKDLVNVIYTGNNQTNVNLDANGVVRAYSVSCSFKPADDSLYTLANAGTKYASLTITKAVVDIYEFSFDNKTVVYDTNPHTIKVQGDMPEYIKSIEYITTKNSNRVENDVQTNAGTYNITAVFSLNDYKNYVFKNRVTTRSATLTIEQFYVSEALVSESIVFDNDTVEFDGNYHRLECYSKRPEVLKVSTYYSAQCDVGIYNCEARIYLKDTVNYYWDYNGFVSMTKVLKITKTNANLDNVCLSDYTHEYDGREHHVTLQNAISGAVVSYEYYYLGELVSTTNVTEAGEYQVKVTMDIVDHEYFRDDTEYYYATLTITPKVIDLTSLEVLDCKVVYNGKPHNVTIKNAPTEIEFELSKQDLVDCGVYEITVVPKYNDRNFQVIGDKHSHATLTITKADYDISKFKFKDITKQYDKQETEALVTLNNRNLSAGTTLDSGLIIKAYENNKHTHVTGNAPGYQIAKVYFDTANPNYNVPNPMTCKIKITPLKVTVKLVQTQFDYTGNEIVVQAIVPNDDGSQILQGDTINVILSNNNNINAGRYITYLSLDNPDYESKTSSLTYYINPVAVDMSDVSFDDVVATYDGHEHLPTFKGNLPTGILPTMVASKMINAGTYTCFIEFKNHNSNYITPEKLTCTVTIFKKQILIDFSGYSGLVEDGLRKNIGVSFIGLIEDKFDDYQVAYSDTPIKSGVYTITVSLNQNCNYTLLNSNVLEFEILTGIKSYLDKDFEIKIRGEGFSHESNIQVDDLNKSYVQGVLDSMGVNTKDYDAFKLGVKGDTSKQEISVSYKVHNRTLNSKYIRIFRSNSDSLQEIDFQAVNNTLKFSANVDDSIVIVYEKDNIETNVPIIIAITILSLFSITSILYLVVVFQKRKKTVTKFIDQK